MRRLVKLGLLALTVFNLTSCQSNKVPALLIDRNIRTIDGQVYTEFHCLDSKIEGYLVTYPDKSSRLSIWGEDSSWIIQDNESDGKADVVVKDYNSSVKRKRNLSNLYLLPREIRQADDILDQYVLEIEILRPFRGTRNDFQISK